MISQIPSLTKMWLVGLGVGYVEVSFEVQVPKLTASMLEKHDWQSPVLRDPYFSRVDAQSSDTPERSTSCEWQG